MTQTQASIETEFDKSFQAAADVRWAPHRDDEASRQALLQTLKALQGSLSKNGLKLDVFTLSCQITGDNINENGTYHINNSYVIGVSQKGARYYESVFVLRHSSGRMSSSKPGVAGAPYLSLMLFHCDDALSYSKDLNSFSKFAKLNAENPATDNGGKVIMSANPVYTSYEGHIDRPQDVMHALCTDILKFVAMQSTEPEVYHAIMKKGSLRSVMTSFMNQGGGLLTGSVHAPIDMRKVHVGEPGYFRRFFGL